MITLQEMAFFIWFIGGLVDLKNQLLLISFFSSSFFMYHIATHNVGLGSYYDDFNRLMKDLLMKNHFVEGFHIIAQSVK